MTTTNTDRNVASQRAEASRALRLFVAVLDETKRRGMGEAALAEAADRVALTAAGLAGSYRGFSMDARLRTIRAELQAVRASGLF